MADKRFPTVTAQIVDEDTVHIGGDMFARMKTCRLFDTEMRRGLYLMERCSECGGSTPVDSAYCARCGAKVVSE